MTFTRTRLLATIAVFLLFTLPVLASAQKIPTQIVPKSCMGDGGCQKVCDIVELASNILNFAIFLGVVFSAVLFAWAGWKMLTAGGNTEVYAQGRRVFGNVLIGLIIILAGWIVIDTLMKTFTGSGLNGQSLCSKFSLISNFEHFYA